MYSRIALLLVACNAVALTALVLPYGLNNTRPWAMKTAPLMTRWAADVDPANVLPEYPRPQMARAEWLNVNGIWQFMPGYPGDPVPAGRNLQGKILVPFPLESAISGVMEHHERVWYRRTFEVPASWSGKNVILHFGAVDWESEVFINGVPAGTHRGGYDGFEYDITTYLHDGSNEILVRVYDPSDRGYQPRGKQALYPGGTFYSTVTGIWQTVWLEPVPGTRIAGLKLVRMSTTSSSTSRQSSPDRMPGSRWWKQRPGTGAPAQSSWAPGQAARTCHSRCPFRPRHPGRPPHHSCTTSTSPFRSRANQSTPSRAISGCERSPWGPATGSKRCS